MADQTGEKNGNWNPNKQSRTYPSQNMKDSIRTRDNNRCYVCWSTDRLHVHHLKAFKDVREHKMTNLLTLCYDCHWKTHRKEITFTSSTGEYVKGGGFAVWMTQ